MSIEEQQRCNELRSRLRATQEQNEVMYALIERTKKMIKRARLERALIMEKLEHTASAGPEEVTPPQSPVNTPSVPPAEEENTENTTKRGGNNKLPNAYSVFCDEEREGVVQQLTTEAGAPKQAAVQKQLSEKWKQLSKEDRKPYTEKAKELKQKGAADVKEESE